MSVCAHTPCTCPVPDEGEVAYCCDHCTEASADSSVPAAFDMLVCDCGHPDCAKRGGDESDSPPAR
jgi:hypothetical protein